MDITPHNPYKPKYKMMSHSNMDHTAHMFWTFRNISVKSNLISGDFFYEGEKNYLAETKT